MDELKMTGNCLKGSRGLLSFDAAFEETEWGRLTKELFTHVSVLVVGHVTNAQYWVEIDIRRAAARSESQALHRPHPNVLYPRLQNMVPQLPGQTPPISTLKEFALEPRILIVPGR
jgi:hypothetical protein